MSLDVIGDLNWLSVAVAAVAYFALGGLWWAPPVFGDRWVRASGVEVPEDGPSATFYVFPALICTVVAIALAMLAEATGSTTFGQGLALGIIVALPFGLGITASSGVFDDRPDTPTWLGIVGGYHVVGIVLASVIVSAW